ncbi:MAG: carbamate kinase [Symbiobacteriia bacterium]
MARTVVVALGGNAILQAGQAGTAAEQLNNVERACWQILEIIQAGDRVVLTHGNGPQVGAILLQQEGHVRAPAMPLDVCGAESQGLIGYFIQNRLGNMLREAGLATPVAALVTQVLVDPADPAFQHPSKPVGPFYTREQGMALAQERGWAMREDAGRGWRRVVPSPAPLAICEAEVIRALTAAGVVVICAGGGGIPVHRTAAGLLEGCEAVIDKDLAAERLAAEVNADLLLILTDVPKVVLHHRQPEQVALGRLSTAAARRHLAEGQFAAGSMGPKVEALVRFAEATGRWGAIASLADAARAARGLAGTVIECQ